MYHLVAKYKEAGQQENLIDFLNDELGASRKIIKGDRYIWKRTFDEDEPLFFMVDDGRLEIKVNKSYLSKLDLIDYLEIADRCKELINRENSVPQTPMNPSR